MIKSLRVLKALPAQARTEQRSDIYYLTIEHVKEALIIFKVIDLLSNNWSPDA